jgi:RND family efflux transporter MFP subunit
MRHWLRNLKEIIKWTLGFTLLALIVAFLAGTFDKKIDPETLEPIKPQIGVPFEPFQATLVEERLVEPIPGTVAAKHETTVSSRILASIEDVLVRAGDTVSSGSPLVVMDSRDLLARELQANERLEASKARLDEAQQEYDRVQALFKESVVPKTKIDAAERAYRVAVAEVDSAKQAVEEARVAQTHARIESPISGRVIDRLAEPGDTAVPGIPLLKLYDPSELRMEAYVRESLASQLRRNDPLKVHLDTIEETIEGTIAEIVPQADPGSRSLLVKVKLPQIDGLYPGMFGRVLIDTGTAEALCIPQGAVRSVGQIHFVTVLREGKPDAVRLVKLGKPRQDALVSVLSGLAEGEEVAVYSKE